MKMSTSIRVACFGFLPTMILGCSPSSETGGTNSQQKLQLATAEIAKLQNQIAALKAENTELKATPSAMLASIRNLVAASKLKEARIALAALEEKHPDAPESAAAQREVEELVQRIDAERKEEERKQKLGLKALRPNNTFVWRENSVKLSSVDIEKRWVFDSYDSEYHYREAPRDRAFVVARITITSKEQDPVLPGIAVYRPNGAELQKLASFNYEFSRWMDYATYLGNGPDYRNDFEHSATIPFSVAASINSNERSSALFVVVAGEGCHTRSYDRFQTPPIRYTATYCNLLKDTLHIADFKDGQLSVLRIINEAKL